MRTSELNKQYLAMVEFMKEYDDPSIRRYCDVHDLYEDEIDFKQEALDDDEDRCCSDCFHDESDAEEHFDRSGCDICNGGASNVSPCLARHKETDKFHVFDICSTCLCGLVNRDFSSLDYYNTKNDEPRLWA